jgi:hypothetical protein
VYHPKEMCVTGRQGLIKDVLQFRQLSSVELAKAIRLSLDDNLAALSELERGGKVRKFEGKWFWR